MWSQSQTRLSTLTGVRTHGPVLLTVGPLPEELWTEYCDTVQEAVIKTTPKKKKRKKAKWLSEEALQTAERRRAAKGRGEKERHTHLNEEQQEEIKKVS